MFLEVTKNFNRYLGHGKECLQRKRRLLERRLIVLLSVQSPPLQL